MQLFTFTKLMLLIIASVRQQTKNDPVLAVFWTLN